MAEVTQTVQDLEFLRVTVPEMLAFVPVSFFRVKDAPFDADKVARLLPLFITNTDTLYFYIMVDAERQVQGILWVELSLFMQRFYVRLLSLSKQYQALGNPILSKVKRHLAAMVKEIRGPRYKFPVSNTVSFSCNRPAAYLRKRCRRSDWITMEVEV